ncbi:DEAD/DEAH box helicase [Diaminobutyricibacter sp. McL0608]|uniref:DEAD/DEAH box helicase n=1 Tax=Leifsonia sp. McL0608 TaxID=3143537 RepID=UPI0031F2FD1E
MSHRTFDEYGAIGRDVGFGYLDQALHAPRRLHPQLVLNNDQGTVLQSLRAELKTASSFTFSVAFVSAGGLALLKQALIDFVGVGEIITSDYLGFNSPAAFLELLALRELGINVRLHDAGAFHPKGYVFRRTDGITAILGSSNLTAGALISNHEWNIRVSAATESDLAEQFTNLLDGELQHSSTLTANWIVDYALGWAPPARPTTHLRSAEELEQAIIPNAMQSAALDSIAELRKSGERRGLVISATGTGKTILAALDVRAARPERVLFVAHRGQILDRAIDEFQRVLGAPHSHFGKLVGQTHQVDRHYVFSTVQTLSRPDVIASLDPETFDYILIDEVHRATATTYQRVIDHFNPAFLLGLTATPERTDGTSVYELFDFNVPYEIRLGAALEQDMLSPFHYYGVADFTFEDGTTTTDATPLFRLVAEERIRHLLRTLHRYGQAGVPPRGLIFCSRTEEAKQLSAELNRCELRGRRLRTIALSGEDGIEERELQVRRLESGKLDYILTVDIFNEGVDIPSVNQVVMLRQTQSAIVFVQQLGRGLRKAPGKEYLVVIDFIGNYANNYLIPIALFGDDSLNRESIRRSLIAAEERGAIAGLSSVQFDRIAQERVLRSLHTAQLDSLPNLKAAIETIRNRLGQMPKLQDFLRFESVDPVILANKVGSYPELLRKLFKIEHGFTDLQSAYLAMLSGEILTVKRLHESVLLRALLQHRRLSIDEIGRTLADAGLQSDAFSVRSTIDALTLDWNTQNEQARYRGAAPAARSGDLVVLVDEFSSAYDHSAAFRANVDDLLETTQRLVLDRFAIREPFTRGRQYSRKDASRLLCWSSNMYSTIYGYRVDQETATCPVFVTLHKTEEVSASTAYNDTLLDPSTLLWYTRSRRTLASDEVRAIVDGSVEVHVFVKKDDAEGAGHYYLGRATAHQAEQTTMQQGEPLPVVRMELRFEQPIDSGVFSYFHPALTS